MTKFKSALKYIEYRIFSKTKHGIHSPFVYNLLTEVIPDEFNYYSFEELGRLRKRLLQSQQELLIEDFGAGSKYFKSNTRKIADIAAHGISSEKYARLLFRLVNYFNPKYTLELGTSIGLTSLYLALAKKGNTVYTIEGCENIAKYARQLFNEFDAKNIVSINAEFNLALQQLLPELPRLDFVFIDGNHRKEATIHYFETILPKTENNSVVIFDDIHWNQEMEEAWTYIQEHPAVKITLDLFFIGIVFFRKEQKEKENFIIRF